MIIRKAKTSDLDTIMALEQEAWDTSDIPASADQWETYLEGEIVYCAIDDSGDVQGVLLMTYESDGLCLEKIFVHPDFQGEGVGRQLMLQADRIQKKEASRIFLQAANDEAYDFFDRLGFEESDEPSLSGHIAMSREPS